MEAGAGDLNGRIGWQEFHGVKAALGTGHAPLIFLKQVG